MNYIDKTTKDFIEDFKSDTTKLSADDTEYCVKWLEPKLKQALEEQREFIKNTTPEYVDIPNEIIEMGDSFIAIWQNAYAQGYNDKLQIINEKIK